MNTPETISIHVRGASKKRFTIDGDPNKIIELNTSDLDILGRLQDGLAKLQANMDKVMQLRTDKLDSKDVDDEYVKNFTEGLRACDKEMREIVDTIFNSKVADVCDGGGTMYDPIKEADSDPRYKVIIDDLIPLYNDDIAEQAKTMSARQAAYTKKYTKKK